MSVQPPVVSEATRRFLTRAAEYDRRLVVETGYDLTGVQALVRAAKPAQMDALAIDGLRWRQYWHPDNVLWRAELEARERARVAIEVSHDLSSAAHWGSLGPSHAELAVLRATPAWVRQCPRYDCRWLTTVYDPTVMEVVCPQHARGEMRLAS